MQSANEAYQQLSQRPDFSRLLEFVRSDNPLVALAVTKREISFTKFLEWILDPIRDVERSRCFAEALLATACSSLRDRTCACTNEPATRLGNFVAGESVILERVVSARAEMKEGKEGRSDLELNCIVSNTPVVAVLEGKIQAKESTDQVAKYVRRRLLTLRPNEVLLPILLELGDDAVGTCTCPWAVCWGRNDVRRWFGQGSQLCRQRGVPVPGLVGNYLDLFDAWDTAAKLRREARTLIERIERSKVKPVEWRLIGEWLRIDDRLFFQEVLACASLRQTMQRHGFDTGEAGASILGRNNTLIISKPSWIVGPKAAKGERVWVHFESRRRNDFRLDIETHPYEGSLNKKPERLRALAEQLRLKAELHTKIRNAVRALGAGGHNWRAKANPGSPDAPNAGTAVRFDFDLGEDCRPEELAAKMVDAIEVVTPIVDSILRALTASR